MTDTNDQKQMSAADMGERTLVTQFLNVSNAAIEENKDDMPFEQLLAGARKLLDDKTIGMKVYKRNGGSSDPYDYYSVDFNHGRFELRAHGKEDPDVSWKVSRDYLEQVVDNAPEYIEHPMRMDWDWLKSRVGIA